MVTKVNTVVSTGEGEQKWLKRGTGKTLECLKCFIS